MNKLELINELKKKYPLTFKEAKFIVEIFFKFLAEGLLKGRRAEMRGFGSFSIRKRKPRTARNPKTNLKVEVGERRVVYFRAGKELLKLVNKKYSAA